MRMAGLSDATIKLRRDHVRSIARRARVDHPQLLTKAHLVKIATGHLWSNEHRRSLRTSMDNFYEYCKREGLVDHNPVICLPKVKPPHAKPRPAPDRVWEELLANADPRETMMAMLAAEAGLRRGEIARTRRDDLIEDYDGWSLIVRGKGDKQRVVPITTQLAAAIRAYCQHGYLFPGQIDGHLSVQYVGTLLSQLMPDGYTAHKLRHRYSTRGFAGTRNLMALKEALGHSSVASTQKYVAVSAPEVRAVSEAAAWRVDDYPNTWQLPLRADPPNNAAAVWSALVAEGVASVTGPDSVA